MKHIVVVWMFAAALAAQQGKAQQAKDPKLELAVIIAVEEQERDLAKAEKLYRAAIADAKLSEAARVHANLRLGTLLQRLDRAAEAKPFLDAAAKAGEVGFDDFGARPQGQDIEREKVLREKAREIVKQILAQSPQVGPGSPLHGIEDAALAEQLLWIGEAAVPEVVAALEKEIEAWRPEMERGWDLAARGVVGEPALRRSAVQGLAGFLWRTGGPASAAFLASCAKIEPAAFRAAIVSTAFQAQQPEMLAEAAKFLNDPDPGDRVVSSLLSASFILAREGDGPLAGRFEAKQIVDAGVRGPLRGKIRLLGWAARGKVFDAATLATLHKLVREGLQSTDPEFGNAANQFLLSTVSQTSIEGLELLLQELPKMKGANSVPNSEPELSPEVRSGKKSRFTAEEVARLLPVLDACARAIPAGGDDRRRHWLQLMMWHVAHASDATIVPTVLAWTDLGYGAWWALGRITPANCKDLFARFDRVPAGDQVQMLSRLQMVDLPADMFPLLRDKAEQIRASGAWNATRNAVRDFSHAMAKTGDPEAADWILAEAARDENKPDWMAEPLVTLGRRSQAENVRAALRKAARGGAQDPEHCGQALLALLSMGDVQALDIVVQKVGFSRAARHPYASNADSPLLTPLQYLLYKQPDPPHGFTDEQVIGVLEKIAANGMFQGWEPQFWSHTAIPDRLLGEFARIAASARVHPAGRIAQASWIALVLERTRKGQGELEGWVAQMLQHEQPRVRLLVLENLDEQLVTRERALVEKCLEVDEYDCALRAAMALTKIASPIEIERLLQNKHPKVRIFAIEGIPSRLGSAGDKLVLPRTKDADVEVRKAAASCLGAMVSKDAVPALIELLRDPDEQVRSRATDALTRIRFYHEQQAHWDRILKGLDASSASAAEKLLLQAKPGAPKEQRLLAITSLGALGVPEALPFLIEWTSDPDADIAAKAKASITQIHLSPRK
ncbi:MAG TPA: HEAT repeat domain-containing protein [Planctomycetota bacterium]|nr:HEAT repeat domain-containing protein [Planctomycetota bacterium]